MAPQVPTWVYFWIDASPKTPPFPSKLSWVPSLSASISSPTPPQKCENEEENHPCTSPMETWVFNGSSTSSTSYRHGTSPPPPHLWTPSALLLLTTHASPFSLCPTSVLHQSILSPSLCPPSYSFYIYIYIYGLASPWWTIFSCKYMCAACTFWMNWRHTIYLVEDINIFNFAWWGINLKNCRHEVEFIQNSPN